MPKLRTGIKIAGVLFFLCLLAASWHRITDEVTRFKTGRSLDEANQALAAVIRDVPLKEDRLIASEINTPYIPDARPYCIRSISYQFFASEHDYEVTRAAFIKKFEDMGWESRRGPGTPYVLINFFKPSGYIRVSIFPQSEFESFRIEYTNIGNDKNIYAVEYRYEYPNGEICYF